MMCDGRSSASWTTNSPRSVSTTRTPARSRPAFSSISSDTIDFDFTASVTPWSRAMAATIRVASAAVSAQWTWQPLAVAARSKVSRWRSRRAIASARMRRASSR